MSSALVFPSLKGAAPATAAGPAVWERVWRQPRSNGKDDALLARERRGPRWSLVRDRLEEAFGSLKGLETIELGSGLGDLSVLLAEAGARVTLLDANKTALERARARFDRLGLEADFVSGDLFTQSDVSQRRYDVSLSLGVIEHFRGRDRTRALRAHWRVLKPRGMAVVSVPNARCVPYRFWKLYMELRGCWPYGLELPYAKRELLQRAEEAGFMSTSAHGFGYWQSVGWGTRGWKLPPVLQSLTRRLAKVEIKPSSVAGEMLFELGEPREWWERPSCLDNSMGFALVMLGRRGV